MTKVCSKCKRELSVSEFHRYKRRGEEYYSQCRDCKAEYKRTNNAKLLEAQKLRRAKQSPEDKRKEKAWNAFNYALRIGKVIKPTTCDACGTCSEPLQAHHANYDEPYNVTWVCQKCHAQLDKLRRAS